MWVLKCSDFFEDLRGLGNWELGRMGDGEMVTALVLEFSYQGDLWAV